MNCITEFNWGLHFLYPETDTCWKGAIYMHRNASKVGFCFVFYNCCQCKFEHLGRGKERSTEKNRSKQTKFCTMTTCKNLCYSLAFLLFPFQPLVLQNIPPPRINAKCIIHLLLLLVLGYLLLEKGPQLHQMKNIWAQETHSQPVGNPATWWVLMMVDLPNDE